MLSLLANAGLTWPLGGSPARSLLAYLDPGSGSMALQVLIAGLLSGLYFLRSSLDRVRSWLSQGRPGR
jgi:hypothetical protein